MFTVYPVHWANAIPCVRVRTVSVASQLPVAVIPPLTVHPTEAMVIGSLKETTMSAVWATLMSPDAGSVLSTNGFTHSVVKDHGFGTVPGTRSRLSFWPFRPVYCALNPWPPRQGAEWVGGRTVR